VWLDSYFPAGHAEQVVFAAFTMAPPPQDVQEAVPPLEYQPLGQFAHVSSPSSKVPAPHALHDVWPALGWIHPLGQFAHVSSPSS
jgi:hypothetical protein